MKTDLTTALDGLRDVAALPETPPHDQTQVAVFGVWNAGKSTLIKRLLVESGIRVPAWLTVAGAPETNFVGTVSLDDDTLLVDTPGISDGMSLHEGEAARALKDADVVIALLLPNLMTAEKDQIVGMLKAQHVHPDGWPWPDHALDVLVAQLDDFGVDPVKDAESFTRLATDKLGELDRLLTEADVALPRPPAAIIADLGADVGDDREDLELSDYERGDWDGVDRLLQWLRDIPHSAVRAGGVTRRLVADASARARVAEGLARSWELQCTALKVDTDGRRAAHEELDLQLEQARNELAGQLEAFAASVYSGDLDEGPEPLAQRQTEIVTAWLERQKDWLNDARIDFNANATHLFDSAAFDVLSIIEQIASSESVNAATAMAFERIFGHDVRRIEEELAKVKAGGDYWEQTDRLFTSEKWATAADSAITLGQMVPVALELYALVKSITGSSTPAHEQQVAALRAKVREANAQTVTAAQDAVREAVDAVRAALSDEIAERQALLERLRAGCESQERLAARIEERIAAVRLAISPTPGQT